MVGKENNANMSVRGAKRQRNKMNRKARVLEKSKGVCHYCQIPLTVYTTTIEHLIPRCRGGDGSPENLVAACERCNCTHKNPLDFNPPKGTSGWLPKFIPHA